MNNFWSTTQFMMTQITLPNHTIWNSLFLRQTAGPNVRDHLAKTCFNVTVSLTSYVSPKVTKTILCLCVSESVSSACVHILLLCYIQNAAVFLFVSQSKRDVPICYCQSDRNFKAMRLIGTTHTVRALFCLLACLCGSLFWASLMAIWQRHID